METKNPTLADQHVGRRLRWRRNELKLSQQELADRLGVTFQQVMISLGLAAIKSLGLIDIIGFAIF